MTTTPNKSSTNGNASYIALVPRGLHHVFCERLQKELHDARYSLSDVSFVGEQSPQEEEQYSQHLLDLLGKRKKQHSQRIGTVHDPSTNQHVSVGYDSSFKNNRVRWSFPGNDSPIWTCFTTNAPVRFINNQLRFIGPLMACVQVWDNNIQLDETISLEQVNGMLQQLSFEPLDKALELWHDHVQDSWPLSKQELKEINAKVKGDSPLTYRVSCVRAQSKLYPYKREDFVRAAADLVVPPTRQWKVNLTNYDVEVVLLVQAKCLAVGLALRPYRQCQAKCFSQGIMPPDISTPYLSGNVLSGLVRLRPTTAQLLWGMLSLSPGDVVMDPCAGIGTIPLEVPSGVVGLGGDLILATDSCRPLAADYFKQMQQQNKSCKADLLAWDAALLPLRSACVDAVVSDLPFGQQCLSSAKLDTLLPLIIGESGRVLRPGGTMLLLCGAFAPILDALAQLNSLQTEGAVWNLPCEAVFPVNIGGLVAWIIKVRRGPAEAIRVPNHVDRARKLTWKRDRHVKHESREATKEDGSKYRRLQK